MPWNTLDVPLETGWQCTLIPGPQYRSMMRRGYDDMSARWLYPKAGRRDCTSSWNARPSSQTEKREQWDKDRLQQLAEDQAEFSCHFRPDWDLRTVTGTNALDKVQTFARDFLNLAHWNYPTDNAGVQKLLRDAVASGQLVPVVNREYRGVPRVSRPDPAPEYWPSSGGRGNHVVKIEVISYGEFKALQQANGELPAPADNPALGATLNPLPDLGAPASADDDFGLRGVVESAAGALPRGRNDDADDSDGADVADDPTPLGDAQPFEYSDDSTGGDVADLAARGVSEGDEAECFAQYERELDECKLYSSMTQDPYTYVACKAQAFANYNQCRGFS